MKELSFLGEPTL